MSFISKNSDVLVVGTHIGTLAIPLSKECNKLIAIEANPHTFNYLQANLKLNDCSNVTSINIAASDKAEKIQFLMSRENSGGSKRLPITNSYGYVYDNPHVIEIDAVPLDELLGHRAFDLILMDIEGSEYFALKGMSQILTKSNVLSVEFLPHHLVNVAGVDANAFLDIILPHFKWLYIPAYDKLIPEIEIREKINALFKANEEHGGIFFLKNISTDWKPLVSG